MWCHWKMSIVTRVFLKPLARSNSVPKGRQKCPPSPSHPKALWNEHLSQPHWFLPGSLTALPQANEQAPTLQFPLFQSALHSSREAIQVEDVNAVWIWGVLSDSGLLSPFSSVRFPARPHWSSSFWAHRPLRPLQRTHVLSDGADQTPSWSRGARCFLAGSLFQGRRDRRLTRGQRLRGDSHGGTCSFKDHRNSPV